MDSFNYSNYITPVKIKPLTDKLNIDDIFFITGSCFAKNIFNRLDQLKLNVKFSPFGNVYNPLSISKTLERVINKTTIKESEIINCNGTYQHHDFHSTMGSSDPLLFIRNANLSIEESHNALINGNVLAMTFGTAYVYEKSEEVVNNCHKIPGNQFTRRLLTVEEIVSKLSETLLKLKEINPKIKFILTLSPVRHLRDDATENSLSKSILRVAIDQICNNLNCYYFPSYEILLDELRDYRWYDDSLTHPNPQSVDIIISKFFNSAFNDEFLEYSKRFNKLQTMLNHKIMNENSEESHKFIIKRENYLKSLQSEYKSLTRLQSIKSSQYS